MRVYEGPVDPYRDREPPDMPLSYWKQKGMPLHQPPRTRMGGGGKPSVAWQPGGKGYVHTPFGTPINDRRTPTPGAPSYVRGASGKASGGRRVFGRRA